MPNTNRPQSAAEQRAYAKRVREREAEGLCTSDAQAVIDAEEMKAARANTKPLRLLHAVTLNALKEMQRSPYYAVRKRALADAECIIVEQDAERDALRERVRALEGALRKAEQMLGEAPDADVRAILRAAVQP